MPQKLDYPRLYGAPLIDPVHVKPLLRDPELHWKQGRSAYEAAHSWVPAGLYANGGWPPKVSAAISGAPEWRSAKIVTGFFEHATALDTMSAPSNTDVLLVCNLGENLGVAAIEAKAGETFGERVQDWKTSDGKARRYQWACDLFGVDAADCEALRWQLFHRTAAAVLEAERFCARHAVMIVHDFSGASASLNDFEAFADRLGASGNPLDGISDPIWVRGISLRLSWVRDSPLPVPPEASKF
ncbi:MAG: DUF6946 family protein [Hyphomonas sp.]